MQTSECEQPQLVVELNLLKEGMSHSDMEQEPAQRLMKAGLLRMWRSPLGDIYTFGEKSKGIGFQFPRS